jgi:hypothetical protein
MHSELELCLRDHPSGLKVTHVPTGKHYTVMGLTRPTWDSEQVLVHYQCEYKNPVSDTWVRSYTEFCDGRFVVGWLDENIV